MMADSDSSFDGIKVDFDDDSDLAQSGTSFQIPDQGGGTASATSPSQINTRSTSLLENGPNSCHNTSNWVFGVRNISLSSDRLNQIMANRGMNFSKFKMNDMKQDYNNVQRRQFVGNFSKAIPFSSTFPMDDIEEVSAENYDTYHSHHINAMTSNYQMIGFTKIKEKRQHVTPADQIFNSELKDKQNCVKYIYQPNNYKRTEAFKANNEKILTSIPSSSKSTARNEFVNEDNAIRKISSQTRTKTCDKTQDQNVIENSTRKTTSTKNESSKQDETSIKLSANYKRSVNLVRLSAKQELQRHRRQWLCESVSLIIIIIGIILVTITPFLLIPIWVIPNEHSPLIRNFLWLSLLISVILLSLAALTGNVYWYYDEKSQKWKWFYHCGKGPADHYWGSTLFRNQKSLNTKEQTNVSSINV